MSRNKIIGLVLLVLLTIVFIFFALENGFEIPEIAFFSIFIIFLLVFMFFAMKILKERIQLLKSSDGFIHKLFSKNEEALIASKQQFFSSPMYFHIFLILLSVTNLILSYFKVGSYDSSYYSRFYNDLVFQFNAAIMFTIIGFLNPFLAIPENLINKIDADNQGFLKFVSNKKKVFLYRLGACILVVFLFIYNDLLVFSNFFQDNIIFKGIDVALILFLIIATFRMVKYAKSFLIENVYRVVKSFSIVTASMFVIVPLAPLTMVLMMIFKVDESNFDFQPIPFIAFNLIMVYVEHSLSNKKKTVINEQATL